MGEKTIDDNCICTGNFAGKVYLHYSWCPAGERYKEYLLLPWYKKLFTKNPTNNNYV